MKKTLRIISIVALAFASQITNAQLINPGFETWTNDYIVPTAMNPNSGNNTNGWWDYNYFNSSLLGSSPVSVTRCTDTVHSGTYSVRLQTKVYSQTSWNIYQNWGIPFIGHIYFDTLGILFNGTVNEISATFKPGSPFNQKITQYKFYYQYKPSGNDTAQCRVLLLNSGNPVAGGVFKTNVATGANGWQQGIVNLTYVSTLTPDTMYVLFSSSSLDKAPKQGSVLWLDDISVTLSTGIDQLLNIENGLEISPNPSKGIFSIHLQTENNKEKAIEVYNIIGEKIYSRITNQQGSYDIDISNSPKGIYFVKLYDGEKIQTKKIVVQ